MVFVSENHTSLLDIDSPLVDYLQVLSQVKFEMTMDLYIDEKDKELGRARLSQGGEGASAQGVTAGKAGGARPLRAPHPLARAKLDLR